MLKWRFLKLILLDPYDRAESAVTQAKISAANDFKALKDKLKNSTYKLKRTNRYRRIYIFSRRTNSYMDSSRYGQYQGLSKKRC